MIRALFGGSFDPVHNGHVAIVQHLLRRGLADRVVVVPAGLSPFKDGLTAVAAERLAMVRLAFADEPDVSVDDREIVRGGVSFTIDTLRALVAERPGDRWRLVIGADNAEGLSRWRESDALLALAEVVVMPRGGAAPAPADGLDPARFVLVEDFDEPVSSTAIRAMLARGAVPDADLPPAVARHIRRRGLYGIPSP
jgi:nicotinate-nucleotide adenylyltransferase